MCFCSNPVFIFVFLFCLSHFSENPSNSSWGKTEPMVSSNATHRMSPAAKTPKRKVEGKIWGSQPCLCLQVLTIKGQFKHRY